jgi:hypothetical protein
MSDTIDKLMPLLCLRNREEEDSDVPLQRVLVHWLHVAEISDCEEQLGHAERYRLIVLPCLVNALLGPLLLLKLLLDML